MAIVSLKCPHCGGSLDLDDSREFGFCQYCGNKIMIQQEINNIIVQNGTDNQVARLVRLIDEHISFKRFGDAEELVSNLAAIDSTYPDIPLIRARMMALYDIEKNGYVTWPVQAEISKLLDQYRIFSGKKLSYDAFLMDIGCSEASFSNYIYNMMKEKGAEGVFEHVLRELRSRKAGLSGSREDAKTRVLIEGQLWKMVDVAIDEVLKHELWVPGICWDCLDVIDWKILPLEIGDSTSYMVSKMKAKRYGKDDIDTLLSRSLQHYVGKGRSIMSITPNFSFRYLDFYPILRKVLSGADTSRCKKEEMDRVVCIAMFDHAILAYADANRGNLPANPRKVIMDFITGEYQATGQMKKGLFGAKFTEGELPSDVLDVLDGYIKNDQSKRVRNTAYYDMYPHAVKLSYN